jgi:hypothetical protein
MCTACRFRMVVHLWGRPQHRWCHAWSCHAWCCSTLATLLNSPLAPLAAERSRSGTVCLMSQARSWRTGEAEAMLRDAWLTARPGALPWQQQDCNVAEVAVAQRRLCSQRASLRMLAWVSVYPHITILSGGNHTICSRAAQSQGGDCARDGQRFRLGGFARPCWASHGCAVFRKLLYLQANYVAGSTATACTACSPACV